jgi:hypothetical protein
MFSAGRMSLGRVQEPLSATVAGNGVMDRLAARLIGDSTSVRVSRVLPIVRWIDTSGPSRYLGEEGLIHGLMILR